MKTCVFLIATFLVSAQAPPPSAPETIVASLSDGTKLTLGELRTMLQQYPPTFMQSFQRDPRRALQEIYMGMYTAAEGDKLKLGEQSPWKEQIEISRRTVVSAAMFNYERNHFQVTEQNVEDDYKKNQARYEQVEVKIIKIAFKPEATAASGVEDQARRAFEQAHAGSNRSEAEAKKLAADIVKQLRAGADLAKLAAQYSDDEESKSSGGDFGVVKPGSPYAENFKKAVLALKEGEVSDPIPSGGNALYIARAEKKTVQPLDAVRSQIMEDMKDAHLREYLLSLEKRFDPAILRPDVIAQLTGAMQRPASK